MRTLTPIILLALGLLLAPASRAAQASGELGSDAPVLLFGDGELVGTGAYVSHHAFRDGSIDGRVLAGRLLDQSVKHVQPGQPEDCRQLEGQRAEPVALTADAAKPWETIEIRLLEGSFARLLYTDHVEFAIGAPGEAENLADPFAYLGPNPYATQTRQSAANGAVPDWFAPAFPTWGFTVVPAVRLVTLEPATLEVYWGELETKQQDRVVVYSAGVTSQIEQVDATNPLAPPGSKVDCSLSVTHTLLFDQDLAVVGIDQSGTDRALSYWDGADADGDLPASGAASPAGYWDRRAAQDAAGALESRHLPATLVGAAAFHVEVQGKARFDDAFGTVTVGRDAHEADHTTVTLAGTINLEPTGSDDGRRMTTRIGDDVNSIDIGGTTTGKGLASYAPYALGAVGGLALVGAGALAWPSLKFRGTQWLLFPLYARLKKEDLLENPLRDDILEVVGTTPGISASELGRRLSCGWGTLVYHLTVLERMQLLSSAREGRHRRFFVQGQINYSDKGAVGLLANPSARTLLDAIRDRPGLIQRDLSRQLGLSAGTVAWHVERLEQAGLIIKEAEGRVVRYYPSSRLLELTKQLAA